MFLSTKFDSALVVWSAGLIGKTGGGQATLLSATHPVRVLEYPYVDAEESIYRLSQEGYGRGRRRKKQRQTSFLSWPTGEVSPADQGSSIDHDGMNEA